MTIAAKAKSFEAKMSKTSNKNESNFLRDLYLTDDNDAALFTVLKRPIAADIHKIYDEVTKRQYLELCVGESGNCTWCKQDHAATTYFAMWVWVYNIDHTKQNDEGNWKRHTGGTRTYFREEVNSLRLLRRPRSSWVGFAEIQETYGNYMGRELLMRRHGVKRSIDTTYTISSREKIKFSSPMKKLVKSLPKLSLVLKGKVTKDDVNKILKACEIKEW